MDLVILLSVVALILEICLFISSRYKKKPTVKGLYLNIAILFFIKLTHCLYTISNHIL